MTEIRDSWREVANKAESLGLKLRLHLEQEEAGGREAGGREPNGPGPSASPETESAEPATKGAPGGGSTRAALDELTDKLKDAFDSFGTAAKDPAVRSDVSDIGVLLRDALMNTFTTVGADVSGAMKDVGEAVKRASSRTGTAQAPQPGSEPEPGSEPQSRPEPEPGSAPLSTDDEQP